MSHFLTEDALLFGLVRTALGYLLLDREGIAAFRDRLEGKTPWGKVTMLSRLPRGRTETLRRAESDLRRHAVARATRGRLAAMLRRHVPPGFDYFNVGHSNLTHRVLTAVRAAQGHIRVMIHDVIPIEHPEFQRDGTVEQFRDKLRRVGRQADQVIYNSDATRRRAEAQLQAWGRVPPAIVAHLGTTVPVPDADGLPPGLPLDRPYFVTVGTIEPRKNHGFLLDVWDALGPNAPPLFICGTRGWKNDAVFARLDALPPKSAVRELPGLGDTALAALVQGAAGMLFPSHAEGFGLPPIEALALGTRVLCNDLDVLHEILGNKPVYASVSDRYLWISTIEKWAKHPPIAQSDVEFFGPTWADHFKTVLRLR